MSESSAEKESFPKVHSILFDEAQIKPAEIQPYPGFTEEQLLDSVCLIRTGFDQPYVIASLSLVDRIGNLMKDQIMKEHLSN